MTLFPERRFLTGTVNNKDGTDESEGVTEGIVRRQGRSNHTLNP